MFIRRLMSNISNLKKKKSNQQFEQTIFQYEEFLVLNNL